MTLVSTFHNYNKLPPEKLKLREIWNALPESEKLKYGKVGYDFDKFIEAQDAKNS